VDTRSTQAIELGAAFEDFYLEEDLEGSIELSKLRSTGIVQR
jgi:hypothetical protein